MTKYQEFLISNDVISESEFNRIISLFPEIDTSNLVMSDVSEIQDDNAIAMSIADIVLVDNSEAAYCDNIDVGSRTITIEDVDNLEELENLKNIFSEWRIDNYEELKQYLKDSEKDAPDERTELLNKISSDASIEQLREFVSNL